MTQAVTFGYQVPITYIGVDIIDFNFLPRLPSEIWTVVPTEPIYNIVQNAYYISNFGRVYSMFSNRLINPTFYHGGYLRYVLKSNYGGFKTLGAHRAVMLSFKPVSMYQQLQVNHIDGVKTNNYLYNLEWNLPIENMHHAMNTGLLDIRNELHYKSFLTNEDFHYICKCLEDGIGARDISESMGFKRDKLDRIISAMYTRDTHLDISSQYSIIYKPRKLFTDEQVHLICKCFQNGIIKYRDVLLNIGIDPKDSTPPKLKCFNTTINNILNRKNYTYISDNYKF